MNSVEMPRKYVPPPLELVKGRIEELMPPEAKQEIDGGDAVLVDVRGPERYAAGHLEGAVNVPAGESARDAHDAAYVEALEQAGAGPDDRVILVCGEGNRSARAADALRNEHGLREGRLDHRRLEALERSRVSHRRRDRDRRRRGRDTLGRRGGHDLMASTETLEDIKARIEEVTPEEASDELASGDAVLIDTRDAVNRQDVRVDGDEFAPAGNGGIESHSEQFGDRVAELAGGRDKRVLLYCNVGNRSAVAADALVRQHRLRERRLRRRRDRRLGGRPACRSWSRRACPPSSATATRATRSSRGGRRRASSRC